MTGYRLAGLALALATFATSALAGSASTLVTVDGGKLRGAEANGVIAFKGIPFARPPIGPLRWRAPQPLTPWRGVRSALNYGHDCMQTPFPSDAAPLGTTPAEDCLVANVWRPADASLKKAPVMVWIYGGGFVNGGSSPAVYAGDQFARQGLVFVSFNYRVGRFGFFAHPALTAANEDGGLLANYGFMDQLAALRWVKANIAAFGGDPDDVTVFGESAGGASVHVLLSTPLAEGLFSKAAILSGGSRGGVAGGRRVSQDLPGVSSGEAVGVNFAKSVGIEGQGREALTALRALSAEAVTAGLHLGALFAPGAGPPTFAGAMVDGKLVANPSDVSAPGGRKSAIAVLVGATSADIGPRPAHSKDELFAGFGRARQAAISAYDPEGVETLETLKARVGSDALMVEPARATAREVSAQGGRAYAYRFSYVAQSMGETWKNGAPHATELPFVFDTVKAKYGAQLTARDAALARAANAYFAAFARTGDPSVVGLAPWPAYDAGADVLLDFASDGAPVAKSDPWRARLDATAAAATDHAPTR